MSEKGSISLSPQEREKVMRRVRMLIASRAKDRQESAMQLCYLGIKTRGSIRTRGSLQASATNRLPEPEKLEVITQLLEETDRDTRCQVALALGEWGGEQAAEALSHLLRSDKDEEVQLYCITSLRIIGGPVAAEALRICTEDPGRSEVVRNAALQALEELITGGSLEYSSSPALPPSSPPPRGRIIRTSGERPAGGRMAENLITTLETMRDNREVSLLLRQKAADVLTYLAY